MDSIDHVQLYWKLAESVYLSDSARMIQQQIAEELVQLYALIIQYQARVVCHLSSTQGTRAWANITGTNGWSGKVATIKRDSEWCTELILIAQREQDRENCKRRLEGMQEQSKMLLRATALLEDGNVQRQRHYDAALERDILRNLVSDYKTGKNLFNPQRTDGTCKWFFEDLEFRLWCDSTTSALFWVSGGPGCGKSVLSRSFIDEGRFTIDRRTTTTCYFFFKDGQTRRTHAADALAAILHQLFAHDSTGDLIKNASRSYQNWGDYLREQLDELWDILIQCAKPPSSSKIVCVLDAIDECEINSRKALMSLLKDFYSAEESRSNSRLKFFVTFRPYDNILDPFSAFIGPVSSISLDSDKKRDLVSEDIDLFIDKRLATFAIALQPEDKAKIAKHLKNSHNRTYLWIHLMFNIIGENRSVYSKSSSIERLLSSLPTELNGAYEAILSRSQDDKLTETLLRIASAASRPLTVDEMNVAVTLETEGQRLDSQATTMKRLWPDFKTTAQNVCGLFLTVYDSKVFLIHQTARGFLADKMPDDKMPGRKWQGCLDIETSHRSLADACAAYLAFPDVDYPQPLDPQPFDPEPFDPEPFGPEPFDPEPFVPQLPRDPTPPDMRLRLDLELLVPQPLDPRQWRHYPFYAYAAENLSLHVRLQQPEGRQQISKQALQSLLAYLRTWVA